jgi:DGQHR domain-containing protein
VSNNSTSTARTSRNTITLPCVRFRQDPHNIYLTAVKAEDLDRLTKIDHFNSDLPPDHPDQGYQRAEEAPRVKKLGNWLRKQLDGGQGVLMPTALLASTRNTSVPYDEKLSTITLSKDHKLHIVDGQHRRAGLLYAIYQKGRDQLRGFEVPLIIVEKLSRIQEMEQFAVVNGTQKGVRTDLVNMILTQLEASKGEEAIKDSDQWKVVVSRTVDALNNDQSGPWHDMIVMPNNKAYTKADYKENPSLRHRKLVRATSFMASLKPIYDYLERSFFDVEDLSATKRAEQLTSVVGNLWVALRRLNPEAFINSSDYVLQKTPGIFALHRLCKRLLPVMHMARRPWDEDNFVAMLEPCEELQDPTFWDAKQGDAAKYGSMKGFAELADLLWESLRA